VLDLPLPQPFAGGQLLRFLAARAIPGVEHVGADSYTREGLRIVLHAEHATVDGDPEAARRLLDLDAPIAAIHAHLGAAAPIPGLRVPGCVDGFELAVRAILGQQVSVAAASTLSGRIAAAYGGRFPTAAELASAEPLSYMPPARARAITALAGAVAEDGLRLDPPFDLAGTRAALLALPGIGPWTVEYVAMRALGDRDAYPGSDLVLRRLDGGRSETWRPYRAYAAMALWAGSGSSSTGSATTAAASTTPESRSRSQVTRAQTANSSTSSATTTGTVAG
jgi:AraC family transcriptional regulator, regulatory protein of adaptative response / DNA-3-methyladenine glycosylase II